MPMFYTHLSDIAAWEFKTLDRSQKRSAPELAASNNTQTSIQNKNENSSNAAALLSQFNKNKIGHQCENTAFVQESNKKWKLEEDSEESTFKILKVFDKATNCTIHYEDGRPSVIQRK